MPGLGKILLVEDDVMVVKMYQRKFLMVGFDVEVAYNGEEGLEVLTRYRPDIVLLDVMMPKMNGFEMLKRMQADESLKKIPVVILTNLGDRADDIERSKEMGATDYWVKANISLEEIVEKVKAILANRVAL